MAQSRRLRIALITVLIVVAIGLVGFGVNFYLNFVNVMRDLYTPSQAANLVILHLKVNHGTWPRSWEELHRTFLEQDGADCNWEELPRRVGIDFTADPAKLATAEQRNGDATFRVVWSLAYPDARLPNDPNRSLLQYLSEHKRKPDASNEQPQGPPGAL